MGTKKKLFDIRYVIRSFRVYLCIFYTRFECVFLGCPVGHLSLVLVVTVDLFCSAQPLGKYLLLTGLLHSFRV